MFERTRNRAVLALVHDSDPRPKERIEQDAPRNSNFWDNGNAPVIPSARTDRKGYFL